MTDDGPERSRMTEDGGGRSDCDAVPGQSADRVTPDHRSTHGEKVDVTRDFLSARSPLTVPGFFAALDDGYLFGGVCDDCGRILVPPRAACFECGGDAVHVENQPTTGTVVSYTEVRHPPAGFEDLGTYTVGVVELDTGARLATRIDAPLSAVDIGTGVKLRVGDAGVDRETFDREAERDWPMFVFEPLEEDGPENTDPSVTPAPHDQS